jgi:hypothetical protein
MRRALAVVAAVAALGAFAPLPVVAASTGTPGQPSQNCAKQPATPAGFSSRGFGKAESVYANPTSTAGLASGNSHVVAQYDVACFQVSHPHP